MKIVCQVCSWSSDLRATAPTKCPQCGQKVSVIGCSDCDMMHPALAVLTCVGLILASWATVAGLIWLIGEMIR